MCRPVISLILPPNVVGFVSVGPTAPCVALWEVFSSIGLELVRGGPATTGAERRVQSGERLLRYEMSSKRELVSIIMRVGRPSQSSDQNRH